MSLPIYVDAYSGYRTNERPQRFTLDDDIYDITAVEDRWYQPDAEYFKLRTTDGRVYLLRYDQQEDGWILSRRPRRSRNGRSDDYLTIRT